MILTFSKDRFVDDIKAGRKITTIREDKGNRWQPGRKIHFWRGNPRNVSKHPFCFGEGVCSKVVDIKILKNKEAVLGYDIQLNGSEEKCRVHELFMIATNDGLIYPEFRRWFLPIGVREFSGKIIYWKDCIFKP